VNNLFEQGPALRAIQPAALPADSMTRASQAQWSQFRESFAETVLSLSRDSCAPPLICWMPPGLHLIRPEGRSGERPIVWRTTEQIAAIANRHLQALRAKAAAGDGPAPFIDFDHQGGNAGEVVELFWEPRYGIRAAVAWTPEGEAAIMEGRAVSFSPHWINSGEDFLGLRACVGGVLSPGIAPAFKLMPPIEPVQKRQALRICAERFIRKVDTRASKLAAEGAELSALQAFNEVSTEHPELHASYDLQQAIRDEHWKDTLLRHE